MKHTIARRDGKNGRVQVIFRTSRAIDQRIEIAAAKLGIQKGRLIEDAVLEYLERRAA